jgi:hypothetical protein
MIIKNGKKELLYIKKKILCIIVEGEVRLGPG